MAAHAAMLMIRHIHAVMAVDGTGDGDARPDSVLIMLCEHSGVDCTALGGTRVKVFKTTVLAAEAEHRILLV